MTKTKEPPVVHLKARKGAAGDVILTQEISGNGWCTAMSLEFYQRYVGALMTGALATGQIVVTLKQEF